jgi:hypothetical protein
MAVAVGRLIAERTSIISCESILLFLLNTTDIKELSSRALF